MIPILHHTALLVVVLYRTSTAAALLRLNRLQISKQHARLEVSSPFLLLCLYSEIDV